MLFLPRDFKVFPVFGAGGRNGAVGREDREAKHINSDHYR